jgi:hypothetical protein
VAIEAGHGHIEAVDVQGFQPVRRAIQNVHAAAERRSRSRGPPYAHAVRRFIQISCLSPGVSPDVWRAVHDSFEEVVISNSDDALVDVYTPGCPSCGALMPRVHMAAKILADAGVSGYRVVLFVSLLENLHSMRLRGCRDVRYLRVNRTAKETTFPSCTSRSGSSQC